MKRGVIFFILLINLLFVSMFVSAQTHNQYEVLISINGYTMNMNESLDNGFLVEGASAPTTGITTSLSIGHDASEIWVSVDGNEMTLEDAANATNTLCGTITSPAYSSYSLNLGHLANETYIGSETLQDKIDNGDFCLMCGTPVTYQGKSYNTVQIGTQCWMQENLAVLNYSDGSPITKGPVENFGGGWSTDLGYYSCPPNLSNNDEDCAAAITENLGYFYQWTAVMEGSNVEGARGICPLGWHIPTDAEFKILIEGQATPGCEASVGWQCDPASTNLKSGGSSNFNVLLAGLRGSNGYYYSRDLYTLLWSSTEFGGRAWRRNFYSSFSTVARNASDKAVGISVRCIKNPTSCDSNMGNPCGGSDCVNAGTIQCDGSCAGTTNKFAGTSCSAGTGLCDGSGTCVLQTYNATGCALCPWGSSNIGQCGGGGGAACNACNLNSGYSGTFIPQQWAGPNGYYTPYSLNNQPGGSLDSSLGAICWWEFWESSTGNGDLYWAMTTDPSTQTCGINGGPLWCDRGF